MRAGAQLLIVPTNTSSYATAQVPTQEIAASEVQAVQQGRDLLQAAPTGYSAPWITHRGVLLEPLGARRPPGRRRPCSDRRAGSDGVRPLRRRARAGASVVALAAGWWLAVRAPPPGAPTARSGAPAYS